MARKQALSFTSTRFALLAVPFLAAVLGGFAGCDKDSAQPERRYCDNGGCYACKGESCYPVPGDPAKPVPPVVTTCDSDAVCGTDRLCNLGRCEAACKDNTACQSGMACVSGRCRPSDAASCGIARGGCTADAQCGADQKCANHTCAKTCADGKCATGQVCASGLCVEDPAPTAAQCVFDNDCNSGKGGFRCVNAYCLPTCVDTKECGAGASCFRGVCRGGR